MKTLRSCSTILVGCLFATLLLWLISSGLERESSQRENDAFQSLAVLAAEMDCIGPVLPQVCFVEDVSTLAKYFPSGLMPSVLRLDRGNSSGISLFYRRPYFLFVMPYGNQDFAGDWRGLESKDPITLLNSVYSPTNGIRSTGDMVFFGEDPTGTADTIPRNANYQGKSRDEPVVFGDENLASVVAALLRKSRANITYSDVHGISHISAPNRGIENIEGLQYFDNLVSIILPYNHISDISPLSNLERLAKIGLSHNRIADVTPFMTLPDVRVLFLSNNQITDIGPLVMNQNLGTGCELYVGNNPLSGNVLAQARKLQWRNVWVYPYEKSKRPALSDFAKIID